MLHISELFEETHLQKGEFFARTGQYCGKLSFIKQGYIRVYAQIDDKEITQWISSKGYFITDLYSFNFGQRGRWQIQALTECELYTIRKENYLKIHQLVPNWAEMEKQFIAACFVQIEDRVFQHLSLSAEERYRRLFAENKELFQFVPQQYIASMLGMSAETLSRIRAKSVS